MENSIFEFADKFGYDSPFNSNWEKEDFNSSNPNNDIPSISLKDKNLKTIPILKAFRIDFIVDGEWQRIGGTKYEIKIKNSNKNVVISTNHWSAERGWTISTYIGTKEPCTVSFQFEVNGKHSNSITLSFVDNRSICVKILTVDDVKNIVSILREKTFYKAKDPKTGKDKDFPLTTLPYYAVDKIFHRNDKSGKYKSEIVTNQSFENFTSQLNYIFKLYEIHNCNRRSHFLAQIFIETQYFSQTIESNNDYTSGYDPWRGRGLLHLTHKENYKKYSKYCGTDVLTNYSLVSTNLEIAADSAGWYWQKGSSHGDINKIADSKTVKEVTKAVQGGDRGLDERKNAFNLLKNIFNEK